MTGSDGRPSIPEASVFEIERLRRTGSPHARGMTAWRGAGATCPPWQPSPSFRDAPPLTRVYPSSAISFVQVGNSRLGWRRPGMTSTLRPLVVNTLGFAERTLQRVGRDNHDPRRDADRVLDENRDLLGMRRKAAAVPVLGARFRQDHHLVHP